MNLDKKLSKTDNTSTGTTLNAKNPFKMPNTQFKSQIYRLKVFVTIQLPYCVSVLLLTSGCS